MNLKKMDLGKMDLLKRFKPSGVQKLAQADDAGLPPGTLVYVGRKKKKKVTIDIIDYNEKVLVEKRAKKVEECFPFKQQPTVTWVNVNGIHDTEVIRKIGKHFELHALIMEDILNTTQRPKIEDFDDYLFITLKMVTFSDESKNINIEHVSFIVGKNYLFSFQEDEGDVFDLIRERIRKSKGKIRKKGPDYLAYSLMDAIVDQYFVILESVGEQIENLEERLLRNPSTLVVHGINRLRSQLIFLRKSVWPVREIVSSLLRGESKIFKKNTDIYLRDLYDHTIQAFETIETYREMASGLLEVYLSSISNKLNEVMKILTIFSTIFAPLTFMVGIYGMNFHYFPELDWKYSYPVLWAIMIFITIVMLHFFKRKKWF